MKNIFGSFVFRNEGDGCLTSKYINNGMTGPLTECSKLQTEAGNDKFIGNYFSVWLDTPRVISNSSLEISKSPANAFYDLLWKNSKKTPIYGGQGMLFGDLLVGCYWSYDLDHIVHSNK